MFSFARVIRRAINFFNDHGKGRSRAKLGKGPNGAQDVDPAALATPARGPVGASQAVRSEASRGDNNSQAPARPPHAVM